MSIDILKLKVIKLFKMTYYVQDFENINFKISIKQNKKNKKFYENNSS